MEITWRVISRGVGGGERGNVQTINSINGRYKIDGGGRSVKNSIGNGKAEELICMTHGHDLTGRNVGGRGCAGQTRIKGRK